MIAKSSAAAGIAFPQPNAAPPAAETCRAMISRAQPLFQRDIIAHREARLHLQALQPLLHDCIGVSQIIVEFTFGLAGFM